MTTGDAAVRVGHLRVAVLVCDDRLERVDQEIAAERLRQQLRHNRSGLHQGRKIKSDGT